MCVCVSVYQVLGYSREGKNGQIYLKFDTFVDCVNPWGCVFLFFWKFRFLGPGDSYLDRKWTKNLRGHSKEGINVQICLKFGTLIVWLNPWGIFLCFKKLYFWIQGTQSWTLNGPKTVGHSRECINGQICQKFGTLITWVNVWPYFFIFWKFSFLGIGDLVLDPKWTKNLRGALGKA